MKIPRRTFFQFAAGGALGVIFTPVPWKVIDDIAIWSQNWSWIPVPPRGETTTRLTACTLCPAGCAVRARCVGTRPVSLAGVNGGLCPAGLVGHHLAYDPARVRRPLRGRAACTVDDALSAVRSAVEGGGTAAILDQRPGRTASLVYRRYLAGVPGGLYLTPVGREDAGLRAIERASGSGPLAYDLGAARAVISFGAPLIDGWGTPGRVLAARPNFKLIQVEPVESRTAAMADLWLPAKPGTEAAVAQALAGNLSLERAAAMTGLRVGDLREAARILEANGPAVAIGGGDPAGPLSREEENAVAALNAALGSLGRTIVARRETPAPAGFEKLAAETALGEVPDGRIGALIIDESASGNPMPWGWLKRKLAPGAVVVSVASTMEGYAKHADYVLPAPVYMETAQDVSTACDSTAATLAVSPALIAPMVGAVEAADFVQKLAGRPENLADLLKARVEAISKAKRGTILTLADGKTTPAAELADAWKAFEQGAVWTDAATPDFKLPKLTPQVAVVQPPPTADGFPLVLVPFGWRGANGPASPLYTKLYQESGVRDTAGVARINPATAQEHSVCDGGKVKVETRGGSAVMTAVLDEGVMPGVVAAAVEPGAGVLEICNVEDRSGWRCAPARMRKA